MRLAIEVAKARPILAHARWTQFADLPMYEVLARYDGWRRNIWVDLSATGPLFAESPFREPFI